MQQTQGHGPRPGTIATCTAIPFVWRMFLWRPLSRHGRVLESPVRKGKSCQAMRLDSAARRCDSIQLPGDATRFSNRLVPTAQFFHTYSLVG